MVSIDSYPLDLTEQEQHNLKSTVTKHPVEEGEDVADHVRRDPREVTLTGCIVSDTPIGAIAQDPTRTGLDAGTKPSNDAYKRLEDIWEAGEPVTVVTSLRQYKNMILDDLSVPKEAKNAGGLVFTAHFTHVRIVQNKRVTVAIPNARGLGAKKPSLAPNANSKAWGQRAGVAGSIFVISFPGDPATVQTVSKSYGSPILIDSTKPFPDSAGGKWAHYQVQGDATPDGYVKGTTYYPMALTGSVEQKDQFGNPIQHSTVDGQPVTYNYADQSWHDDRDNSVVKVPPGEDPWKTATSQGPSS